MRRSLVCVCAVLSTLAAFTAAVPAAAGERAQGPKPAGCGSDRAAWAGTYKHATKGGTFTFRKNGTATLAARSGATRSFTFQVIEYAKDDWRARLSFADNGSHLADLVPQCASRQAPGRVSRFNMLGRTDFERR
ncbi:hypothetical protein [Streptomyces sp. NPDC003032]